jgi:hypothetical protein
MALAVYRLKRQLDALEPDDRRYALALVADLVSDFDPSA